MRLLLFLSAILSALTGVAGPRAAVACPVAASTSATAQVIRVQTSATITAEALTPAPRVRDVAVHGAPPKAFALHPAVPLYADCLRE